MRIIVYLGTGGVGKTSVAAATALAQARAGMKSLVLTIDPALRLRTALHLKGNALEQMVPFDPPLKGELWAALLDVRATLDEAVRVYGKPESVDAILRHPVYATIADSLVGMQELMAVERIDQLSKRGFENIVVDTAPSRHALEFLDKPLSFSDLTSSGWVQLAGRTYQLIEKSGMMALGRKTIDVYTRVEAILGAKLVRQILDFYSLFVSIAEGYSARAQKTIQLLKDPDVTEIRVVTAPQKALRDARFFTDALKTRQFRVSRLYVNRVWEVEPGAEQPDQLAHRLMDWYSSVQDSQLAALAEVKSQFGSKIPLISALPELEQDIDGLSALERISRDL